MKKTHQEKEKEIKKAIKEGGVLGVYENDEIRGYILNPQFKESFMGSDLSGFWYDFKENRIKKGKFINLFEINIIRKSY